MNFSRLTGPVIIASIICGLFFPIFKIFLPAVPVLLGIVIFSTCMDISVKEVFIAFKNPKYFLVLLLVLFLVQPFATFFIAKQFITNPLILAGIVLLAMGPAPAALGFWVQSLKSNVSLAMAFITVSHILTPLILPVLTHYLLSAQMSVDTQSFTRFLALIIVIPMALGILLQRIKGVKKYASMAALPSFFLFVAALIAANAQVLFSGENLFIITAFILFQCTFSFLVSLLFSRKWDKKDREVLILGTFARNNAIVMAVAIAGFGELAALPGAVAIVVQLVIVAIYLFFKKHA